jgi:hypothetical protein
MNNHNFGNPIIEMSVLIGLNLVSWVMVVLDHFHLGGSFDLRSFDLYFGMILKVLATVGSVLTIMVARKKLKEGKPKNDGEGK